MDWGDKVESGPQAEREATMRNQGEVYFARPVKRPLGVSICRWSQGYERQRLCVECD
jgi:hypothetical protein